MNDYKHRIEQIKKNSPEEIYINHNCVEDIKTVLHFYKIEKSDLEWMIELIEILKADSEYWKTKYLLSQRG